MNKWNGKGQATIGEMVQISGACIGVGNKMDVEVTDYKDGYMCYYSAKYQVWDSRELDKLVVKPIPDHKQVAIDDIKNKLFTVNKKFTQDEIAEFIYDNYTQLEQAKEQLACSKTNFDILYKERDWFVDELEQTQKELAQEKKKFLELKKW